jgi:hypothetical protein
MSLLQGDNALTGFGSTMRKLAPTYHENCRLLETFNLFADPSPALLRQ